MKYLEFNRNDFSFSKASVSVWRWLKMLLGLFITSLSAAVLFYVFFALFFSTPEEKRLREEIREYSSQYSRVIGEDRLICDAITALQAKDAEIYQSVFNSAAPNVDPIGKLDFLFASDTLPDKALLSYTHRKACELEARAERVDSLFAEIFSLLGSSGIRNVPMSLPLEDIGYMQVGAGYGNKFNPFYKARVDHAGVDFIVPPGTPVLAAADGTVSVARRSAKGQGNVVEVSHGNGYFTLYAHLSEVKVRSGQIVRRGSVIGCVGMSGTAFAPHLHYEVRKDTVAMNPIGYIFASVAPSEYANMLFMSSNTLQSMD